MRTRIVLFLALVLLVMAVPTFAAGPCSSCTDEFTCDADPNIGLRCRIDLSTGLCSERPVFCINAPALALASEYTVASVDLQQPQQRTREAVAAPQTAELRVAQK